MARTSSLETNQQPPLTASSSPQTDRLIQSARLERFLAELAVRAVLNRTRRKEDGRHGNS
jgi:hypothetical protein